MSLVPSRFCPVCGCGYSNLELMFVFRVLNTVPYSNEAGAKDLIASLHSFLTSNLLVGLAVVVSWKQFGGKPIECMVPTDFTNAWVQYAENYCWAQDTYFVPFSSPVAHSVNEIWKTNERVSYYQWMPFFLLFEAACFKLPCFIWKYFASQSGMRVGEILRIATDDHNTVPEVKKANIEALCVHLQGALRFQKRLKIRNLIPHKIIRVLNIKYSTYYVTFIYFLAKFAFLINVGVQTKLMNEYLLPRTADQFGFHVWRSLWAGNKTWMENGLFPRVTLCDFEVREMGNIQTHTVQCVLLINIFTEKIFILLWAWYLLLGALTMCNLSSWLFGIFSVTSKEHFIINHLEMCETPLDTNSTNHKEHVDRFMDKYLGLDGVFLLRLIAAHADIVFTTELIGALWKSHYAIEEQRKALKQMNRVLPILRPESCGNDMNLEKLGSNSTLDRTSITRKSHLLKNHATIKRRMSVEEMDQLDKKNFGDSSSDEEKSIKDSISIKCSRKSSRLW